MHSNYKVSLIPTGLLWLSLGGSEGTTIGSWEVCKILETLPKSHISSLFFIDSITLSNLQKKKKKFEKEPEGDLEKITDRKQDAFETDSLTSG